MGSINKILIVASESMLIDMVMRHLKRKGFLLERIEENSESRAGVTFHFKNGCPYDLIIADIFSAKVDGINFCSWFKNKYPHIPMLLLSGYGTLDMTMKMLRPELDSYCRKPFTPDDMMASLAEIEVKMQAQKKNVHPPISASVLC